MPPSSNNCLLACAPNTGPRSVRRPQPLSWTDTNRAHSILQLHAELDRIVLKDSCSQRQFANTATCRKAVITTRILQLVHE